MLNHGSDRLDDVHQAPILPVTVRHHHRVERMRRVRWDRNIAPAGLFLTGRVRSHPGHPHWRGPEAAVDGPLHQERPDAKITKSLDLGSNGSICSPPVRSLSMRGGSSRTIIVGRGPASEARDVAGPLVRDERAQQGVVTSAAQNGEPVVPLLRQAPCAVWVPRPGADEKGLFCTYRTMAFACRSYR